MTSRCLQFLPLFSVYGCSFERNVLPYLAKSPPSPTPHEIGHPFGATPSEFCRELWCHKTRVPGLLLYGVSMTLCLAISVELRLVPDGHMTTAYDVQGLVSSSTKLSTPADHNLHTQSSTSFVDAGLLAVPRTWTTTAARALRVTAPRIWNSLPETIRSATSVSQFTRHLKSYLFSVAFS